MKLHHVFMFHILIAIGQLKIVVRDIRNAELISHFISVCRDFTLQGNTCIDRVLFRIREDVVLVFSLDAKLISEIRAFRHGHQIHATIFLRTGETDQLVSIDKFLYNIRSHCEKFVWIFHLLNVSALKNILKEIIKWWIDKKNQSSLACIFQEKLKHYSFEINIFLPFTIILKIHFDINIIIKLYMCSVLLNWLSISLCDYSYFNWNLRFKMIVRSLLSKEYI